MKIVQKYSFAQGINDLLYVNAFVNLIMQITKVGEATFSAKISQGRNL